jgi:hypothetical protein
MQEGAHGHGAVPGHAAPATESADAATADADLLPAQAAADPPIVDFDAPASPASEPAGSEESSAA